MEELDNIECLVEVEEWRVAVPEAQSSVSDIVGPAKYLQALLGTLQVSLVVTVMNRPISYKGVYRNAPATPGLLIIR